MGHTMSLTEQTQVENFLQQKKEGQINQNQHEVITALREYQQLRNQPSTAKELFEYMVETRPGISPMDYSSYQPRLTKELREKGFVEVAGKRECTVSEKQVCTWKEAEQ